jgi:AcrR family transcriptional regulator
MTTELNEKLHPKAKKPDKREAIIEAARGLFTTEGYEATTIAEIAKKAGVAVGTVYLYFKNKPELLDAVQGDWEAEYVAFMQELDFQEIPHYLRARPLVERSFQKCVEQSEMVQLMGLQRQQLGGKKHGNDSLIYQGLERFLEEGIARGHFRPVDVKTAAVIAFGMVEASLRQCFDIEGGKDQERYINTLVEALEQWLRAEDLKIEQ